MGIYYFLALFLLLAGVEYNRHGYYEDNLNLNQAYAIKGFFILLVFISHFLTSLSRSGFAFQSVLDSLANQIQTEFGQLIVAMFLFYSGYGVTESLKKKGAYLKVFPKKRILTSVLNFDVSVIIYILLSSALGIHLGHRQIIYSLFAWKSVGNIDWYFFAIIFCYSAFYLGSLIYSTNTSKVSISVFFLVLVYIIVLSFKKQHWWYDTILCFPTGCFISTFKTTIISIFKQYYRILVFLFSLCFFLLHFLNLPNPLGLTYNIQSVVFTILIVLMTMKIKTGNRMINWIGLNLFPIYMYHCVPMIVLSTLFEGSLLLNHPHLSFVVCFLVTMAFAWGYRFWRIKLR